MPRLRLAGECYGIDGIDGRQYNRDRTGCVEVPESVARHMRGSEIALDRDATIRGVRAGEEKMCSCGFVAFKWQTDCPRCGSSLDEEER